MGILRAEINVGWEYAFAPSGDITSPADGDGLTFRPAVVPGTNLTDLQVSGLVEPDTSAAYELSFAPYREMDFIYRTRFDALPEGHQSGSVLLCFDGLDTVCDIFLNGEVIGQGENAYIARSFEISAKLRRHDNELVLIFRSPDREAEIRQKRFGLKFQSHLNCDFMFLRKPAYSFFWDWGPEMPVSGIYRPVYLLRRDRAWIEDYYLGYDIRDGVVYGSLEAHIGGDTECLSLQMTVGDQSFLTEASGSCRLTFEVRDARLWYPNGEGEPALYEMEVCLLDGEEILDAKRQRIGFRKVEIIRDERRDGLGTRFLFRVNGRDIFCRGYNWIPVDSSIPRGYYGRYRANLELARESGVNMLRVWGGGYYEDDEFYRLCDEMGIMVWQDGMFACSLYPDADADFLASVREELEGNILRLRNFTSLVLWCGENEIHWGYEDWGWEERYGYFYGREIYDRLFPELVAALDPQRLYWNGSPYSGIRGVKANSEFHGDTHFWDLHTNCRDFTDYSQSRPSFVSETGIQSLPDLRTALTIGLPQDKHIQSFVFDTRNRFESPAKNERLLKFAGALFRVGGDFDDAVILSGLAHAEYLKYAVEHWRSLAFDCAGVLIWQLNDCWPTISWSAVDYNLIPKACHYYMKRAFAADLVSFQQGHSMDYHPDTDGRGRLRVITDRDGAGSGRVELRIIRIDGDILDRIEFFVHMTERGVADLGEVLLPGYAERRFDSILEVRLLWEDGRSAGNIYTLSRPKHMWLPAADIRVEQESPTSFIVRSDIFAKGVYLFHPDKEVIFSDNYLDLLPGEERLITTGRDLSVGDIRIFSYHH